MSWVVLTLAIVAEVAATLALRASNGFRVRKWISVVVVGYVSAFSLLGVVLALGVPVTIAYAIWTAVGIAATAVLGRIIFDDHLSALTAVGLCVVVGGVILIELGSIT